MGFFHQGLLHQELREDSSEDMEPVTPTGKARRPKGKGKGKSEAPAKGMVKGEPEPIEKAWPPVAEILAANQNIPERMIDAFLGALGCNEQTTMETFQALSARDIAEANDSDEVKTLGSPLHRASLFKLCRELAMLWGGEFAASFDLTGPRGEALPPRPRSLILSSRRNHPLRGPEGKEGRKRLPRRRRNGRSSSLRGTLTRAVAAVTTHPDY